MERGAVLKSEKRVPLSGAAFRSACDEALADLAQQLINEKVIVEQVKRDGDGWIVTYEYEA